MIIRDQYLEDSNIGLFALCNEKDCFIGKKLKKKFEEEVRKILKVNTRRLTIFGLDLVGLFGYLTENTLFLPKSFDYLESEINEFKNLDYDVIFLETKHNALGNIAIISKNKVLLSKVLRNEKKVINSFKDYFDEVEFLDLENIDSIGQLIQIINNKALASNLLSEENLRFIKEYFKLSKIVVSTINFGSPYIKSGIIGNSNGIIVGKKTTGYELFIIQELFEEIK